MKAHVLIAAIGVLTAGAFTSARDVKAQPTTPCDIAGRWVSEDNDRDIEIEIDTVDAKWVGRVVRSSSEDTEPGFLMLRDFSYEEDETRYKGKLASPSLGEVSAEIECVDDDVIKVTGRKLFFSRSITWRRVPDTD